LSAIMSRPQPTTPKKWRQKTLHGYVQSSSSPAAPSPEKSSSKFRRRRAKSPPKVAASDKDGSESEDVGAVHFEPEVIDLSSGHSSSDHDEDEEDDDSPIRPATSRFRRDVSSSSDDLNIKPSGAWASGKRRLRRKPSNSDSDSEGNQVSPKKQRLTRRDQDDDGDDDDGDLMDEVDKSRLFVHLNEFEHSTLIPIPPAGIIDARFRARDKKSEFQKNLEKLKRTPTTLPVYGLVYVCIGKKRGKAVSDSSSSSEEEDSGSDESSHVVTDFVEPFEGAKPDDGNDSQLTEIDSFIVEDAETEIIPALPALFSMNTHQDLAHHFKIICQLFVHLAVRPARERKVFMREVTSCMGSNCTFPCILLR
jgi:Domain of unknown function (DUF4211)